MVNFDIVVVGAGFSGAVIAERFAGRQNRKVLVVEQRKHIAGNCFDYIDDHGVSVHKYGPHLFHTDNKQVWEYLSRFTEWRPYQHRVLASIDGRKVPLPFNLNSLHQLYPATLASKLEQKLISCYGFGVKVPILELRKADDEDLKQLANYIYEKVFVNYTAKQWGCKPEYIAPEVTGRVPVFISRDDRYFQDRYQAVPKLGYIRLFENLLAHRNIHLMLNTRFSDIMTFDKTSGELTLFGNPFKGKLVYTGMLDELFDYCCGELPYRSLRLEFESYALHFFQETTTVNYPNDYDFTRITEFKHITQQTLPETTIVREYPQDYNRRDSRKNIPYYPIFKKENQEKYKKYRELAENMEQLVILGRLADYRYYDMDDAVDMALNVFKC